MARIDVIEQAVLAALGHTKPDYRSIRKLGECAREIARFVDAELDRDVRENCKHPMEMRMGSGSIGSDGSSKSTWFCRKCGASGGWETPPREVTSQ